MGTTYQVKMFGIFQKENLNEISIEIEKILKEVNKQMSTYIPDSEISLFNQARKNEKIQISNGFFKVLNHSLKISSLTGGVFDPTIGPLVNLWGFGPNGEKKIPKANQIKQALKIIGFEKLNFDNQKKIISKKIDDLYLDLSSLAKGYAVDEIYEFLKKKEIKSFMVEIGGELRAIGHKGLDSNGKKVPWVIGIETPGKYGKLQKVLKINDVAVATSGDYRNQFKVGDKTYSHTINIKTGKPIDHKMTSVTVIDPTSCMNADAWATAFMAMGPKRSLQLAKDLNIMAYFIYRVIGQDQVKLVEKASPTFERLFPL